jgi:sugar phosphate isomerase/epimerase
MEIGASYWGRDGNELPAFILKAKDHFKHVRFSYWATHLHDASLVSTLVRLRQKYGLHYNIHMLWGNIDLSCNVKNIRLGSIAESKEAIDYLSRLGGGVLNFHPSLKPLFYKFYSDEEKSSLIKNEIESFKEIVGYAKDKDVIITIENASSVPSNFPEFRSSCNFKFHEIFLREIPDSNFGINFDTGHFFQHSNVEKLDMEEIFSRIGKRIKYVHAHDNDGTYDQHSALGKGRFGWPLFLDLLHKYGFSGTIELELKEFEDQLASKEFLLNLRPAYF